MRCPKRLQRRRDPLDLAAEALERRHCLSATVAVTLAEPTVIEGEAHVATIRLSQPLSQVERVLLSTADRTATFGKDYFRMTSEQVVFLPGETSKTVSIKTLRDASAEPAETFQVTATPVNPRIRGASTLARIEDYVAPPLAGVAGVVVTEGVAGDTEARFTITLSARYPKAVSVNYATRDGSATVADTDYRATIGRLTFAPGETSKTVSVNVVGDRKVEADESFSLVLSAPVNAVLRQSTATGTIRNDEINLSGYQITLEFLTTAAGAVPQSVRDLATEAAAKWSRVIVGDLPSVTDASGFVDDILIRVQLGLLGQAAGGPGGMLANARSLLYRDGGMGLPYVAEMGLDPADVNLTTGSRNDLLATIVHEMGHGLGFPDAARFQSFVQGALFTGPNARREYARAFGIPGIPPGVPLETGGGAATQGGHWNDEILGRELMTGYLESGVTNPLSRITVGAFQDMGYSVSYSAADAYQPLQATGNVALLAAAVAGSTARNSAGPVTKGSGQPAFRAAVAREPRATAVAAGIAAGWRALRGEAATVLVGLTAQEAGGGRKGFGGRAFAVIAGR